MTVFCLEETCLGVFDVEGTATLDRHYMGDAVSMPRAVNELTWVSLLYVRRFRNAMTKMIKLSVFSRKFHRRWCRALWLRCIVPPHEPFRMDACEGWDGSSLQGKEHFCGDLNMQWDARQFLIFRHPIGNFTTVSLRVPG